MNKNYRLLSFRSFFIFFFSFLSFFEGSPSSGFFWVGGEAKNTVLPESFFTFRFFHFFFIFTLFHFFTFFYIFRFFHFFTFLHFYNFSEVTLVVVFFFAWGPLAGFFFLFLKGVSFFFSRGGTENFLFLKKEGSALDTLKTTTTCRPLQAKFYNFVKHFQNQRDTISATYM